MEPARQGVERADRRSRIRQKGWERPLTIQLSHLVGRSTRAALGPRAGTSGGGWEGRQRVEIGIGDRVLNVRSIKPNASMISPRRPAGTGPRRSPRRPKQCLPAISRAGAAARRTRDRLLRHHHDARHWEVCGLRHPLNRSVDNAVIAREGSGSAAVGALLHAGCVDVIQRQRFYPASSGV